MMMCRRFVPLLLLLLVASGPAFLATAQEHGSCDNSLTMKSEIVGRPRPTEHTIKLMFNSDQQQQRESEYQEFVNLLAGPEGILAQLGIAPSRQILQFMSAQDLRAILATSHAKPVTHYWDGAQIVQSYRQSSSILEVIFPGKDLHHGYYSENISQAENYFVILHVQGHNFFAENSHFEGYRGGNPTLAAEKLDEILVNAYQEEIPSRVENFYFFLLSLSHQRDMHTGLFETPADFPVPDTNIPRGASKAQIAKLDQVRKDMLTSPTENVFPAVVARLPSHFQTWQKEMAQIFPQLAPFGSALRHTQIMNEGIASYFQELLMPLFPEKFNNTTSWLRGRGIFRTQEWPILNDPYWLGVRIWQRIHQRFKAKNPDLANLSEVEQVKKFLEHAARNYLGKMDDKRFIREEMDDEMIQLLKLAITRTATDEEAKKLPPPPQWGMRPVIILSKDPARIREMIIQTVVRRKTLFTPRVKLTSFNLGGKGELGLVIDDPVGKEFPMDTKSLGPAMYLWAMGLEKPISMECSLVDLDNPVIPTSISVPDHLVGYVKWFVDTFGELPSWLVPKPEPKVGRFRVVVDQMGTLNVYRQDEQRWVQLEETSLVYRTLENPLHDYLQLLHLEDDNILEDLGAHNPRFAEKIGLYFNSSVNSVPLSGLFEHVPVAAEAIARYQAKVENRMLKVMELVSQGKGNIKRTSQGVFVQALPGPEFFSFDMEYVNKLYSEADIAPMVQASRPHKAIFAHDYRAGANPFDGDQGGQGDVIGPTDLGPGDGGWRPKPRGGGGEPKDPGEEPLDPRWVQIDDLYGQFLGEKLKLPNLKPKKGATKSDKTKLQGRRHGMNGQFVRYPIEQRALNLGIGSQIATEQDPFGDLFGTLVAGFGAMMPSDYVVKARRVVRKPDFNAVVAFALDASGSTWGYYEVFKRFVYDLEFLLKQNYKNVRFEYIIFDSQAHRMKDAKAFFGTYLGGGTSYAAGMDKVKEIMQAEYPRGSYDRFVFPIGDFEDFDTLATQESFETLLDEVDFMGGLMAGRGGYGLDLYMRSLAERDDVSFVELGPEPVYSIEHMKKLLKNEE